MFYINLDTVIIQEKKKSIFSPLRRFISLALPREKDCYWAICKYRLCLSCFILIPCFLSAQNNILSKKLQCPPVTGNIATLLNRLSECSGVIIEFSPSFLNSDKIVSLEPGGQTLGKALDLLLAGQNVMVSQKNNKIILAPSPIALPKGSLLERYTLYGYVQEEKSLEPLPFASLQESPAGAGCQANHFGYYSINLPEGPHKIIVSYAGYSPRLIEVNMTGPVQMNLAMQSNTLPEVKLNADHIPLKDGGTRMDKYEADAYNNMLGESDPVRSLYLLPGNVETQETTGKLLVRGGDPDQSLFLLDGNRVFNPTHLLGEISIINETTLKSIRQFKNDFPARFYDALSSITEVSTKDGNMNKWNGEATASLLAGAFTINGPLIKGKTAVMASLRHSWTNPVLHAIDDNYRIHFYDIHFKITHLLDRKNKLMLSGYLGKDRLNMNQYNYQNLQLWGNRLANLNWNHTLGPNAFVNTSFHLSNYHNMAGMKFSIIDDTTGEVRRSEAFNNYASIEQLEAKTQFEVTPSNYLQLRFGGRISRTVIHPFKTNISPKFREELDYYTSMASLPFSEFGLFYESEIRPHPKWLIRPAIHFSGYTFRDYHYNSFQPRFFASYRLANSQQVYFSYAQMGQLLHQVSTPFLGINSELWVPSTALLKPGSSTMLNLGYQAKLKKTASFSAELYYKKMNNVTNFAEKGNIFYDEDSWETDILSGKGWSYGAELFITERRRKWAYQVSYALAWSWRQFAAINGGQKYPFRYDRRHQLNIALNYQPANRWDLNLVWYFSSGDWLSLPNNYNPDFGNPDTPGGSNQEPDPSNPFIYPGFSGNGRRTPSYHRLNFNTSLWFRSGRHLTHKISAGVYNAYLADDKYIPDIWNTENNNSNITLSRNRLFRFTGYLTYTIRF